MWVALPPAAALAAILPEAIDSLSDRHAMARLTSKVSEILHLDAAFESAAQISSTHLLLPSQFEVADEEHKDMSALYTKAMVRGTTGSAGRQAYDLVRASRRRCASCNERMTTTVDHYLPKHRFRALAISPQNLTPMCGECNTNKGMYYGKTSDSRSIHPYFDDFDAIRWLDAAVNDSDLVVEFSVVKNVLNIEDEKRAEGHLKRLKLHSFYSQKAAAEIVGFAHLLEKRHAQGGQRAVEDLCTEFEATWRSSEVNSWKAATWRACALSQFFCDGGFKSFVG